MAALVLLQAKLYDDLLDILKKHFNMKSFVIAKRFDFHCRNETAGESVAEHAAEQRCLVMTCEFAAFYQSIWWLANACGVMGHEVWLDDSTIMVIWLWLWWYIYIGNATRAESPCVVFGNNNKYMSMSGCSVSGEMDG